MTQSANRSDVGHEYSSAVTKKFRIGKKKNTNLRTEITKKETKHSTI